MSAGGGARARIAGLDAGAGGHWTSRNDVGSLEADAPRVCCKRHRVVVAANQHGRTALLHNDSRTPTPSRRCLTDDGRPRYQRSALNRPPETAQAPRFSR